MSELRQKMIRAMELKNFAHHTQRSYLSAVNGLAKHYRQSPKAITDKMIEDYLLYLKNVKGNAPGSCCMVLNGLRFFYTHILDKQITVGFSLTKKPRKLPTVLTQEQVWKIVCAPKNLKHRLILMTTYSAGLTFAAKNRKKNCTEPVTISAVEFIRRFLLHSLPKGFVRIRHYGFLANRDRSQKLSAIRHLMGLPDEVYVLEKPHLKPLPAHMVPVYKTLQRIVDMSGFVTVDTNRYSVPEKLCGKHVEVLKSWHKITIYHKHRQVADHKRLIDKKDGKVVAAGHHLPLYNKKNRTVVCKEEKILLGRSQTLEHYVAGIKKSCYGSGRRKLQKLLELQRTYPVDAFDKAVETALHYRLYDLERVENLILSFVAGDFFNLNPED